MNLKTVGKAGILGISRRLRLDAGARALERGAQRLAGRARVRVINLHGTPRRDEARLRAQLAWVTQHYQVLSPQALLAALGAGAPPELTRPAVVFTFDDGLASNHDVAAPLLESFGARGLFFVNPGFAQRRGEAAREFFVERVCDGACPPRLTEEDWAPMTPAQIAALQARGHLIGNHTLTHARLSRVPTEAYAREVDESAALLGAWLGREVETFAWTFSWDSICAPAWRAIQQRHRFCFTPCPGTVELGRTRPQMIWRTNVRADMEPNEFAFFYSGLADPFWSGRRRQLRRICAEAEATP